MHWNYRVIRRKTKLPSGSVSYSYHVHEVYYDDKNAPDIPTACSVEPIPVLGESLDELKRDLLLQLRALDEPPIDMSYFDRNKKKAKMNTELQAQIGRELIKLGKQLIATTQDEAGMQSALKELEAIRGNLVGVVLGLDAK